MLPAAMRMRAREDFEQAVRRGRRSGSGRIVVHLFVPDGSSAACGDVKVGFVVSRRVGSSVTRHRVQRRLRHAARDVDLAPGARLVVRALPASAKASFAQLREDLVTHVGRTSGRRGQSSPIRVSPGGEGL